MLNMNTPQKGKVRWIVFKEKDTWYASCLEFNIVESGDDARIALVNMFDTMTGYIESVRKVKGSRYHALNQNTEEEYEKLWTIATSDKKIKSPLTIESFGYSSIVK
jgi:hypothetical protein